VQQVSQQGPVYITASRDLTEPKWIG